MTTIRAHDTAAGVWLFPDTPEAERLANWAKGTHQYAAILTSAGACLAAPLLALPLTRALVPDIPDGHPLPAIVATILAILTVSLILTAAARRTTRVETTLDLSPYAMRAPEPLWGEKWEQTLRHREMLQASIWDEVPKAQNPGPLRAADLNVPERAADLSRAWADAH